MGLLDGPPSAAHVRYRPGDPARWGWSQDPGVWDPDTLTLTLTLGTLTPPLIFTLGAGALTDAVAVLFTLTDRDTADVVVDAQPCYVLDEDGGIVEYAWASGDTDLAGTYDATVAVTYGDSSETDYPEAGPYTVVIA